MRPGTAATTRPHDPACSSDSSSCLLRLSLRDWAFLVCSAVRAFLAFKASASDPRSPLVLASRARAAALLFGIGGAQRTQAPPSEPVFEDAIELVEVGKRRTDLGKLGKSLRRDIGKGRNVRYRFDPGLADGPGRLGRDGSGLHA